MDRRKLIDLIYQEELGRSADAAGLNSWLNSGLDEPTLRARIGASQEGRDFDRRNTIKEIYYNDIARSSPDKQGLEYWMGRRDLSGEALRRNIMGAAGVDYNAANANQDLMADPAYAAFLRKLNLNESQIQSGLQAAQEAADRRIKAQAGAYDMQREQGARGINRDFEARGMYRAGGRLKDLNTNRTSIDRQQTQFESGVLDTKAAGERDAANKIADLRRQRAEQELSARDRLTTRSAGM